MEAVTPPRTAVAPMREYMPGWMCQSGNQSAKHEPMRAPNELPSMMEGMNSPPGTDAPQARLISSRYVKAWMQRLLRVKCSW